MCSVHMHVPHRVSGDRIGMHQQRPQVRVMHRKQILEQRRMPRLARVLKCTVPIYISDYHAQPRLFSIDHVLELSVRINVSDYHAEPCLFSVDHVHELSVRIYISNYHAQPCLFDKSLHVLWRNWRHRERLRNAQYRQVCVLQERLLSQRRQLRTNKNMHVRPR